MAKSNDLEEVRHAALEAAEKAKRRWVIVVSLFALVEGACILVYVVLAYRNAPLPILLGVAILLVYSTQIVWSIGLKNHLNACTLRILDGDDSEADRALLEKRWFGVANLGVRPTLNAGRSMEVHVLDFDGDLYDRRLRVGFVARLRGEQKFASLDALKTQIARDVDHARAALEACAPELLAWI